MKLQKRIDKEYRQGIKRFNALYAMYRARIMAVFADHADAVLQSVLTHLSVLPENPDYIVIRKFGIEKRIAHDIGALLELCADQMAMIYEESHRSFDLYGRLFSAYLARKASPPWVTVKVNLKDEIPSKRRGLGTAQFHYHMNNLSAMIVKQINLGLLNGESNHKIMQRVRSLVKVPRKKRESRGVETFGYRLAEANNDDQYYFDMSQEVFQTNPYEVTEGVFSLEDVQRLQAAQERAFGWSTRDLGDGLVQARQNRVLQTMERDYMSDMVERLHAGMTSAAEDNLGIQDYVWVVSKPQPECDECTDRDGMTMTEIKDTFGKAIIKGSYPEAAGDSPPPLHPHCATAGHWIETDKGSTLVESIRVGDTVKTVQGNLKKVTRALQREVEELIEVTLEDGTILIVTPEHPLMTSDGKWTEASKLSVDSLLIVGEQAHENGTKNRERAETSGRVNGRRGKADRGE